MACAVLACFAGCRSGAFPQYPENYREYAYVANAGSGTVSVLDLVRLRLQSSLQVGTHPVAIVASPSRNEVYVASQGSGLGPGSLAIVDTERNVVAARVTLGRMPSALAVDPPGDRLYAANASGNNVSVLDLRSRRLLGTVGVGEGPDELAVSPDNRTLVVANRGSDSVSLMDLSPPNALPKLRSSFAGCPGASSIVILPNSSKAFIACSAGHQVLALGLRSSPTQHRGSGSASRDTMLALLDVGEAPVQLALKPDGGEIFAMDRDADAISEIATETNEVGGATIIGARPRYGVVSGDNSLLWVANSAADTVAVYSIDDGKLVNTVHVGSQPGPVLFSADGHLLLTADARSGDVSVLRTFSRNLHREPVYGTLFTLLPAGTEPAALAVKAFRLTH